ncbi:MAG: indolepyruvate oxidoreductase subunit beta [Deltaproteobacteria bacterium]|nr:indolepyruvate oxidoreductase subunit beta [Deltaproteobacteria bacterium]
MGEKPLSQDPYNLIITGTGGQGNVLASRMVGEMLSRLGLQVTIGETFGASQRGGSVMSHLRISERSAFSPQIPKGRAHMVVSLEPAEAIRVLKAYGNPAVKVLTNTRPIHPIGVISGDQTYPSLQELKGWIKETSQRAWFMDSTAAALAMGNPILGNVILVGALAATAVLPLERKHFEAVLSRRMSPDKVALNLSAYDTGASMIA